ncbi:hypothetical protein TNCV_1195351 [Trichonephila clavipes]|nr:hypothetical protein TNCV_1195351 [Trichonephila clavipes]
MRVLNRSRPNDRLRVMLAQVHTAVTPPHISKRSSQGDPLDWLEELGYSLVQGTATDFAESNGALKENY